MKAVLLAIGALWGLLGHAQNSLLINEIQVSNQSTITAPDGGTPDWIEIFNPTNRTNDLLGMRLAIAGDQHIIDASLKIPPRGYRVLWCSGDPSLGADHLNFKLPRTGGSLLLIAADGTSILDVFTWPKLFADESIGRHPDGARSWRFFITPSPGASNDRSIGLTLRTPKVIAEPSPGAYAASIAIQLKADGSKILYTTDGSKPTPTNGLPYTAPIPIKNTTAIRARAFDPNEIPGREFAGTYLLDPAEEAFSIILDRPDMWDTITGISANGPQVNYTRSGRAWERPAYLQMPWNKEAFPVGLRISGSGSRSLAKRSFKVYARNRYDSPMDALTFADGTSFDEGILRADASPHAFLRNVLMEAIAAREEMNVAVQPSMPVPLYINANYHGLYRWMPPKDAQWLRHITGADAVDVLDGPAHEVLSGSDQHFNRGLELLVAGAPADSIAKFFDLESLIDLACLDLFTGRADHDLNVRTFRPREESGRWKWVLYDMDLWAPMNDNSLERMSTAPTEETPYVPQLIENSELQHLLLARMAALNAGLLAPEFTLPILDSIQTRHAAEIDRDHQRWENELQRPSPQEALTELQNFLEGRGEVVMEQLAERTGHALRTITIDVPDASLAQMTINGIPLQPGRKRIQLFSGVPMVVELALQPGVSLVSWTGFDGNETRIVFDPARIKQLRPKFADR